MGLSGARVAWRVGAQGPRGLGALGLQGILQHALPRLGLVEVWKQVEAALFQCCHKLLKTLFDADEVLPRQPTRIQAQLGQRLMRGRLRGNYFS